MTRVKITCGGYGRTVPGRRTVKTAYLGEVIEVEDAEALRLEKIGAARILRSGSIPEAPAKSPTEALQTGVATPPVDPAAPEAGNDTPGAGEPVEDDPETPDEAEEETEDVAIPDCIEVRDGHMTVKSLLTMTKADLLTLAREMDLNVNDKMSKGTIANLISEIEVGVDDEAVLPELSQEEPTV